MYQTSNAFIVHKNNNYVMQCHLTLFQISYIGLKAEIPTFKDEQNSPVETAGPEAKFTLLNLMPFTSYTITVTCINGAGLGNTSMPVEVQTAIARKAYVPVFLE